MAKQAKRKGKTFITEHYVHNQKTLDALNEIMIAWMSRQAELNPDWCSFMSDRVDEISIWAEPKGMFCGFGHSSPNNYNLVRWSDIPVDDDTVARVLVGLKDVFLEYGKECPPNYNFKVILNESTFHDIIKMFKV